jgi:cadherin 11 type 2 (OB-cadherin)
MQLLYLYIDASVDTTIITVTASDSDSPSLIYAIVGGNDDGYFKINTMHGVIQTARSLDREQIPVFDLLVEAQDEDSNRGTTRLQVTISDVNDEAPRFLQSEYFARVSENSPRGTQIIPVSYFETKGQWKHMHKE